MRRGAEKMSAQIVTIDAAATCALSASADNIHARPVNKGFSLRDD
jgi:hypothetical protein